MTHLLTTLAVALALGYGLIYGIDLLTHKQKDPNDTDRS
jgi:hypothetical protein